MAASDRKSLLDGGVFSHRPIATLCIQASVIRSFIGACSMLHKTRSLTDIAKRYTVHYRVAKKLAPFCVRLISSSNIDELSNLFHFQNQKKILIILTLKIASHLTTTHHYLVKYQCLKSNN